MNPALLIALAPLASLGAVWLRASLPATLTLAAKGLVVLAVLGNLTVFAVAIRTHFARVEGVPAVTRGIAVLGAIFGVWQVVVIAGAERWIVWRLVCGLALCARSLGLFVAALRANRQRPLSLAGARDVPTHLNQAGPYRWVRHPFYASYLLTWLGGAIVSEQPWLFLAPVVMGAIYEHSARAEEGKFLRSALAGEYRRYMQRTGRFLPRLFSTHNPTPS